MIRISKVADYGIVLVSHLARQGDRSSATAEIAASTGVPRPMTGKILKQLARCDLLRSHRGVHGGYSLAKPPTSITVTQIVEALDGPIALTSCLDLKPDDCGIEQVCPARANWQRINTAIRAALSEISIAEMATAIPEAFLRVNDAQPHTTNRPRTLEFTAG